MSMKTPLYQLHLDASAEFVDYRGWQIPIHYGSQIEEHNSVRDSAGVFDLSHRTIIDIVGNKAQAWLRTMLTKARVNRPVIGGCDVIINHRQIAAGMADLPFI